MSANTAPTAITLMAGFLLAGPSSVLAAEPPATLAQQAHTEEAQTGQSTTEPKSCAAWWLHAPSNPPKTQKGKTGPTPEHMRKGPKYKPPKR